MPTTIESKVSWSTLATLAASVAVAVLNGYSANNGLIPGLPSYLQPILILIVPTLVTFLSGYTAPHTSRPDLTPPVVVVPPSNVTIGSDTITSGAATFSGTVTRDAKGHFTKAPDSTP